MRFAILKPLLMEPLTLTWTTLAVLAILPAIVVAMLVRAYYRGLLNDVRLERHIDLEASKAQHDVEMELVRSRLDEETKAHLRTIQLLTRTRDHNQTSNRTHALEESLRLIEEQEVDKITIQKSSL